MPLRVIAGSARGRKLKTVPGDTTRPILDRVKENLFNILGDWVDGSTWIDLFAGTGSVGIEALSRGARHCLFLDTSPQALRVLSENLRSVKLDARATIRREDAFHYLRRTPGPADAVELIYVAPPQYRGMWKAVLGILDEQPDWVLPDGLVVAQIDPKEYEVLELRHLALMDSRTYGSTMLCFYERPGD